MSDYGHIGEALGTLALIAFGAIPMVIGLLCALLLALAGFSTAAIIIGAVGIVAGLGAAYSLAR